MTVESAVRIASLFPEILGTYGDGGNVLVLQRRLLWRGLAVEVVPVPLGAAIPGECDLYVIGGGEDDAQLAVLESLRSTTALRRAVARDVPVFAVCAGLQLLGRTFALRNGEVHVGLDLLDVTTTRLRDRAVGEVLARPAPDLGITDLTGFENHGGRTVLGPAARRLAQVVKGVGNGGPGRDEGALQGSIVATYLHGPVLARNPELADVLLSRATGQQLEPLDLPDVTALRRDLLAAG